MHRLLLLLLTSVVLYATASATPVTMGVITQKVIRVEVKANGDIFMGRDTIPSDELAKEIQTRLWKSYLGTDHLYDSISIHFEEGTTPATRKLVTDAINDGLQKALNEICIQKHKRIFENLSSSQQRKIRKQFPVLFQAVH